MKIGNVVIDPPVVLAPMAGVTDKAFRVLCKEMGCGLTVTEMVSAKAILYKNRGTARLMSIEEAERPTALQLFGSDPEIMGQIAAQVHEPYDIIDINMGCPVPKVFGNGDGSALMKDPQLAGRIVESMVRSQPKPVTVKFRKGIDDDHVNAVEFAKVMEASGASAVAVHGRTRVQMYAGEADWDIIRQVKEAVSIPVIGNGDVTDGKTALALMEQTGCDAVMVGRAARGNPWIFKEISEAVKTGKAPEYREPVSVEERIRVMRIHAERLVELKGERTAFQEMRRHAAWYTAGIPKAAGLRRALNEVTDARSFAEWLTILGS